LEEFGACWEGLEDPRTGNAALHDFHDLLMIALCTVLSGGQNAMDMAVFGKAKEPLIVTSVRLSARRTSPALTLCNRCESRSWHLPMERPGDLEGGPWRDIRPGGIALGWFIRPGHMPMP
jgi:DDE_Tnp_1-associated